MYIWGLNVLQRSSRREILYEFNRVSSILVGRCHLIPGIGIYIYTHMIRSPDGFSISGGNRMYSISVPL